MSNIINFTDIKMTNYIDNKPGQFRAIVKVQAGFMTTVDDLGIQNKWERGAQWKRAIDVFRNFKKGALQTIQYQATGSDHWLTVFARKGKTIIYMDQQMFQDMQVADINQNWSNTNLYNQKQYQAVKATNWESKAFITNK
jgi:predicted choloylglycine hydrolase